MARTERQQDRAEYRKTQRMLEQTHGGFAGRSIIEMLSEQATKAADRYLTAKANAETSVDPAHTAEQSLYRGELRGLARAISLMQNPHYPTRNVKQLEREAADRAKALRSAQTLEGDEAGV